MDNLNCFPATPEWKSQIKGPSYTILLEEAEIYSPGKPQEMESNVLDLGPFSKSPQLDFGTIFVGTCTAREIWISNSYEDPVEVKIDKLPVKDNFEAEPSYMVLDSGKSQRMVVRWTPKIEGGTRRSIRLIVNDTFRVQFIVFGTAKDIVKTKKSRHPGLLRKQKCQASQSFHLMNNSENLSTLHWHANNKEEGNSFEQIDFIHQSKSCTFILDRLGESQNSSECSSPNEILPLVSEDEDASSKQARTCLSRSRICNNWDYSSNTNNNNNNEGSSPYQMKCLFKSGGSRMPLASHRSSFRQPLTAIKSFTPNSQLKLTGQTEFTKAKGCCSSVEMSDLSPEKKYSDLDSGPFLHHSPKRSSFSVAPTKSKKPIAHLIHSSKKSTVTLTRHDTYSKLNVDLEDETTFAEGLITNLNEHKNLETIKMDHDRSNVQINFSELSRRKNISIHNHSNSPSEFRKEFFLNDFQTTIENEKMTINKVTKESLILTSESNNEHKIQCKEFNSSFDESDKMPMKTQKEKCLGISTAVSSPKSLMMLSPERSNAYNDALGTFFEGIKQFTTLTPNTSSNSFKVAKNTIVKSKILLTHNKGPIKVKPPTTTTKSAKELFPNSLTRTVCGIKCHSYNVKRKQPVQPSKHRLTTSPVPVTKAKVPCRIHNFSLNQTTRRMPSPMTSPTHDVTVISMPSPLKSEAVQDERWMEKQERGFIEWLNVILAPECDYGKAKKDINLSLMHGNSSKPSKVHQLPTRQAMALTAYSARRTMTGLRQIACKLFQSPDVQQVIHRVEKEIEKGRLAVRTDCFILNDIGAKTFIKNLLLSYEPLWLKIGIETAYGKIIFKDNHNVTRQEFDKFLSVHFFSDTEINSTYAHPGLKNIHIHGFQAAMSKFTLKKFLSLVYFLDVAKSQKIIRYDPILFSENSIYKSSKDILTAFSMQCLRGEGDLIKHLSYIGYNVFCEQTLLDEFDYRVQNLSTDLTDGIRLARLVELLTGSWTISSLLYLPPLNKNKKLYNVQTVLDAIKKRGISLEAEIPILGREEINAEDIAGGHREHTLLLLWRIVFNFQVKVLLDENVLREEVDLMTKNLSQNVVSKMIESEMNDEDHIKSTPCANDPLILLLFKWCRLVCSHYGMMVNNDATSFKDGRAFCYLIHHYNPSLLPLSLINAETTQTFIQSESGAGVDANSKEKLKQLIKNEKGNFRLFKQKMLELGGMPLLMKNGNFLNTMAGNKLIVAPLVYLCHRLLEIKKEIKASYCIQRFWKNLKSKKDQNTTKVKEDGNFIKLKGLLVKTSLDPQGRSPINLITATATAKDLMNESNFPVIQKSPMEKSSDCPLKCLDDDDTSLSDRQQRLVLSPELTLSTNNLPQTENGDKLLFSDSVEVFENENCVKLSLNENADWMEQQFPEDKHNNQEKDEIFSSDPIFNEISLAPIELDYNNEVVENLGLNMVDRTGTVYCTPKKNTPIKKYFKNIEPKCFNPSTLLQDELPDKGFSLRLSNSLLKGVEGFGSTFTEAESLFCGSHLKDMAHSTNIKLSSTIDDDDVDDDDSGEERNINIRRIKKPLLSRSARSLRQNMFIEIFADDHNPNESLAQLENDTDYPSIESSGRVETNAKSSNVEGLKEKVTIENHNMMAIHAQVIQKTDSNSHKVYQVKNKSKESHISSDSEMSIQSKATSDLDCQDYNDISKVISAENMLKSMSDLINLDDCYAGVHSLSPESECHKKKDTKRGRAVGNPEGNQMRVYVCTLMHLCTKFLISRCALNHSKVKHFLDRLHLEEFFTQPEHFIFGSYKLYALNFFMFKFVVNLLRMTNGSPRVQSFKRHSAQTKNPFLDFRSPLNSMRDKLIFMRILIKKISKNRMLQYGFQNHFSSPSDDLSRIIFSKHLKCHSASNKYISLLNDTSKDQCFTKKFLKKTKCAPNADQATTLECVRRIKSLRSIGVSGPQDGSGIGWKSRDECVKSIQDVWRTFTTSCPLNEMRIINFQACIRGYYARKNYQKSMACIRYIQMQGRTFVNRQKYYMKLEKIVYLQACFRMMAKRSKFLNDMKSIIIVQSVVRRKLCMGHFKQQRNKIIQLQNLVREFLLKKGRLREEKVIKLQALIRGYLARRSYQKALVNITRCQAMVRGFLWRKRYEKHLKSIAVVQNLSRRLLAKRSISLQFQCLVMNQCAIKIQSVWRGHVVRRNFQSMIRGFVKLQILIKDYSNRKLFQQKSRSATKIQNWWKRIMMYKKIMIIIDIMILEKIHVEAVCLKVKRSIMAAKIQYWFKNCIRRGKKAEAAIKIQSFWRGRRIRLKNPETEAIRKRLNKATKNVTKTKILSYRTQRALENLFKCKQLSHILEALINLEIVTRWSPECCQKLAEGGALSSIVCLIQCCNRSIPHRELLKYSISVLINLSKCQKTLDEVLLTDDLIGTILNIMGIFKEEDCIFIKSCELLGLLACDEERKETIMKTDKIEEKIISFYAILSRKFQLEKKHLSEVTEGHSSSPKGSVKYVNKVPQEGLVIGKPARAKGHSFAMSYQAICLLMEKLCIFPI